jgi:hypothetical protein
VISICFSISNDFSHLSVGDLHDASSEPSTSLALERISLERDVFTDVDHRPLDAKIVNGFSTFRNEEPDNLNFSHELIWIRELTTLTTDETEELLDWEPSIA